MGLGSKLGQFNAASSQQLQGAKAPVSQGGYNANNLPALQPSPPMTQVEVQDVRQVAYTAQSDYLRKEQQDRNTGHQVNTNGLVKPTVPTGSQYPDPEVSNMVVEKMWRIVCLKELHSFYTQEQLQALVDRACRHDYSTACYSCLGRFLRLSRRKRRVRCNKKIIYFSPAAPLAS